VEFFQKSLAHLLQTIQALKAVRIWNNREIKLYDKCAYQSIKRKPKIHII